MGMDMSALERLGQIKLRALDWFQDGLWLLLRGWWGFQFAQAGYGKLMNLERPTQYFETLGIPAPKLNAILAGSTECFGGALLAVGLLSRPAGLGLSFTMAVAYATAHRDELLGLFQKPDAFTEAAPFLFLVVSLLVVAHGPGMLSLDALLVRLLRERVRPVYLALLVGRSTAERILGHPVSESAS